MNLAALAAALSLALSVAPAQPPAKSKAKAKAKPLTVLTLPRPTTPEWFGLYVIGQKAGWSKSSLTREVRNGKPVLVGRAETTISATVGSRSVTRSTYDEKVYEGKPAGRLLSFASRRMGDGGERQMSGRCDI